MPTIPFPNVPNAPGVPSIPRIPGASIQAPTLATGSANTTAGIIPQTWGVFLSGSNGTEALYPETQGGELSFFSFGLDSSTQVSDFPIEAVSSNSSAMFASYNKVYIPTVPVVTLSFAGTDAQKLAFLSAIDQAKNATFLWDIYTPGNVYVGYTIERYSYRRTARFGASLLMVEISFKQVKQVTATYTNTPVVSPQSPSAKASVNSGITQPAVPSSILGSILGSQAKSALGIGGQQ